MHLSNRHYRIARLEPAYLQSAINLLAQTFLDQNQVWKAMEITFAQAREFMSRKIDEVLEWEEELREEGFIQKDGFINFVYLGKDDKVVAAWINVELTQHLNKRSKVHFAPMAELDKYFEEHYKLINPKDLVPGRNLHGLFLAKSRSISIIGTYYFAIDGQHWLHAQGFRNQFTSCTNAKALAYMLMENSEIIAEQKAEMNGKNIIFSETKWPMTPLYRRRNELSMLTKATARL